MNGDNILQEIRDHLDAVISQDAPLGKLLWQRFIQLHPADIADFLSDIDHEYFEQLYSKMPESLQIQVFQELSDVFKVNSLSFMNESERADALNSLPPDKLTDLFDLFSDEELKVYLTLLNKTAREKVLSLLKFDPESAGGIMDTQVLVLMEYLTVEKSIQVLQRLQPDRDIYQQIYITDQDHRLVGYIKLEDLVLQNPKQYINAFMRKNSFVALAYEDRETVAKKMVHYKLSSIPVIDENNNFLGAISGETLADVLVEEASEDVQKISALAPLKHPYFETSFFRLLFERGYILIALLLAQSFSTTVMKAFQTTLEYGTLLYFTTMLISTGGNTSSQTSALVIQGLATGQLHRMNIFKFLRREFLMASMLALVLGAVAFFRAYFASENILESLVISGSLSVIVMASVMLGSLIPLLLKRLNIDPAFSAGPFLATLMDILGILIYCYISRLILM
jgi:magnesium transporter